MGRPRTAKRFLVYAFCALNVSWAHAAIVTPHDTIPDLCQNPGRQSVHSGNWSDPTTWSPAGVPQAGDNVGIGAGMTITYDVGSSPVLSCVGINGALTFRTDMNTQLWAGNIMVYAPGQLTVGTQAQPVNAGNTAEIIIANKPLNIATDPDQFGAALIGLGKVTMHGAIKTPTFLRLAAEPKAGQTSLQLAQAVSGWKAGDLLVLPDTRQILTESGTGATRTLNQYEVLTVNSVSADGLTVTLTQALKYNHLGARDMAGTLDFLPHVGNLTRNVNIRSESPTGTRGHTLFTYRADTDVRYVGFIDLGRTTIDDLDATTNHIGRYPYHAHHLTGPATTPANGYQFTAIGNSLYESTSGTSRFKWTLTVHDSHYGLIQDNVMYNVGGAHLVTEDGSESFNMIDHNFAVRVEGTGDRVGSGFPGREGIGFWFRGPNNYIRNNVAADESETNGGVESAYGFKLYFVYLGNINIPNFKGADTTVAGQFTTKDGNTLPLLEFSGNETYGGVQGLTYWWLCAIDMTPQVCSQSVIKDMKMWHIARSNFYAYPGNNILFDGWKIRGDTSVMSNPYEPASPFWFGDYMNKDITIRNIDMQGTRGLTLPYFARGTTTVENSYFRTQNGIINVTSGAPGSCNGCTMPDRLQIFRNNKADVIPGQPLRSVTMDHDLHSGSNDLTSKDEVFVCNHQQVAGDNFQVFYLERGNAPCTTTRPDIHGYVCATAAAASVCAGTPPPPPPTSGSACDINKDGSSNVSDVQLEVNQAIGVASCSADINKDGQCNVIDVQRVVNAALGGTCVTQ